MIPTNFYFLVNLVEYAKTHYFSENRIFLTLEQEEYFMKNLSIENNAFYILEKAQKRKELENFLYEKLGFFRYQASVSSFMLVDMILYGMENAIYSIQEFYKNSDFINKWQIYDEDDFKYKMNSISFSITSAFKNMNPEVYKAIFGDTSLHRALLKYIKSICTYLKEQEFTRNLSKK